MSAALERAAVVALLRSGRRAPSEYSELVEAIGSAIDVLGRERDRAGGQVSLLPRDLDPALAAAGAEIAGWEQRGLRVLTVLDDGYPANLRLVHDRPPLIFIAGELSATDVRSVAVIGSRGASASGLAEATRIAQRLVGSGFTVISGLASGIDTRAHEAALDAGGRTLAVIGTGIARCYPPQNEALQRRIAAEGAVVSQFWPDAPPSRASFPMRNAVMSGLARGTVVVEASQRSGARIQARLALAHGRPVFLTEAVLVQPWAAALARRPGVHVVRRPDEIAAMMERADAGGELRW